MWPWLQLYQLQKPICYSPSKELDICDIEVEELVQESRLVEDEFVNESDDDLRIEEDEEIDEIMHFVFGEEIDSDCEM